MRPTLFIGLGSTGVEILLQLQELIMEAYGPFLDTAGLSSFPCFAFIGCDTDEATLNSEDVPGWMSGTQITACPLTVHNVQAIRDDYKKHDKRRLRAWLPESVLHNSPPSITAGTTRERMMGRFCLWENLFGVPNQRSLHLLINDAKIQITSPQAVNATTNIVTTYHQQATGRPWPVGIPAINLANPRVILVGTLCGGTGSSTMIDVAYLTRRYFGGDTQGIFTMMDSAGVLAAEEGREVANTVAALRELDFYMDQDFVYEVTFPGNIGHMRDPGPPFDYVYLVSCHNEQRVSLRPDHGDVPGSLNHMVAMNLLAESVVGLADKKQAVRIVHMGHNAWMQPNADGYLAAYATFGLSSFWHPRNRIANAAACHCASEVIAGWVSPASAQNTKQAVDAWNETFRNHLLPVSTTLETELRSRITSRKEALLQASLSDFRNELESIRHKLEMGEYYDTQLRSDGDDESQWANVWQTFLNNMAIDLKTSIDAQLDSEQNVPAARHSIQVLKGAIKRTLRSTSGVNLSRQIPDIDEVLPQRCPETYPDTEIPFLNCSADLWCKLLALGASASEQLRRDFLVEFEEEAVEILFSIRDFRARTALQELIRRLDTLDSDLAEIERFLGHARDKLHGDYDLYRRDPASANNAVDSIVLYEHGSMRGDIKHTVGQLAPWAASDDATNLIIAGDPLHEMLRNEKNTWSRSNDLGLFTNRFVIPLRNHALNELMTFNVAEAATAQKSGVELQNHGKRCAPALETRGPYTNLGPGASLDFIAGPSGPALNNLNNAVMPNGQTFNTVIGNNQLQHLVLLYRERPLLEINANLNNWGPFLAKYEEVLLKDPERPLHVEPDPAFFDKSYRRRKIEARDLQTLALCLFSIRDEEDNWKDSEVFQVVDGGLELRLYDEAGNEFLLTGLDEDADTMAINESIFDKFQAAVVRSIQEVGDKGMAQRKNTYLRWVEQKSRAKGEKDFAQKRRTASERLGNIVARFSG